jgi:hypothetical protein
MAEITATTNQNDVNAKETEGTAPTAKKTASKSAAKSRPGRKPAAAVKAAAPKAGHDPAAMKKLGATETKASVILKKLTSSKGATIQVMTEATGWQAHSVRGFLSAVVKKKLGLNLVSETGKDGVRRYHIQASGNGG